MPAPYNMSSISKILPHICVRSIEISAPAITNRPKAPAEPTAVTLSREGCPWQISVQLRSLEDRHAFLERAQRERIICIVGDYEEARSYGFNPPHANAVLLELNLPESEVRIHTTVTGLPPVFLYSKPNGLQLSSPFLPSSIRGTLSPDLDGIADTLRWGHPIDGRTLFSNLSFVPSCSILSVGKDSRIRAKRDPEALVDGDFGSLTRREILEQQLSAFRASAGRISYENAFLSLTGGLDSRTSLIGLLCHGHHIPCVTMASDSTSLDLRLAREVCRAFGLRHYPVMLNSAFAESLPQLALEAANLTGGVSSLGQTTDLYLYKTIGNAFSGRISGNLGNQAGRGGVESLSAYTPEARAFSPALRNCLDARPVSPWFIGRLSAPRYGDVLFGEEVPYWSVGNYIVGYSKAAQLTPYADRRLLQLSRAALALDPELKAPSWQKLRARDLRHRLAGTQRSFSFQRHFLVQHGSAARDIPLNWGWLASGGWSPKWFASAMVSALDAGLIKLARNQGPLQPITRLAASALPHRSALADWPQLVKTRLRELTLDALASRHIKETGIFDNAAVSRLAYEHFAGESDYHYTVMRSLEIALAFLTRAAVD